MPTSGKRVLVTNQSFFRFCLHTGQDNPAVLLPAVLHAGHLHKDSQDPLAVQHSTWWVGAVVSLAFISAPSTRNVYRRICIVSRRNIDASDIHSLSFVVPNDLKNIYIVSTCCHNHFRNLVSCNKIFEFFNLS